MVVKEHYQFFDKELVNLSCEFLFSYRYALPSHDMLLDSFAASNCPKTDNFDPRDYCFYWSFLLCSELILKETEFDTPSSHAKDFKNGIHSYSA